MNYRDLLECLEDIEEGQAIRLPEDVFEIVFPSGMIHPKMMEVSRVETLRNDPGAVYFVKR